MDSEPATDYLLPPMPQSPAPQQSARVAIICVGDSLSTGFSLQSSLGSILAARFRRHYGWFDSPDMSCLSIASLTRQIDDVLARPALPQLVLIWIGHNDLDCAGADRNDPINLAQEVTAAIGVQTARLFESKNWETMARTVLNFGLINFRTFFVARDEAESIRKADGHRYPYFDRCYDFFPSMRPEFRPSLIEASELINGNLRRLLGDVLTPPLTRLRYSDALHAADIRRASCLSSNRS